MRKPKLTAREIASLINEVLEELKAEEGIDKTDWALECLERAERKEEGPSVFQRVRAELHRSGVRHSNF